jgi:hypothetical protein
MGNGWSGVGGINVLKGLGEAIGLGELIVPDELMQPDIKDIKINDNDIIINKLRL